MGFVRLNDSSNEMYKDVNPQMRGTAISFKDQYGVKLAKQRLNDMAVHDSNFAFLTTTLAKLHKDLYEPLANVTYGRDVDIDMGGGFVDYVEYYTVDWSGITADLKNLFSNNATIVPRVNASMSQKRVNVFTYEIGYDLKFIELEKMKQIQLQKSIQTIYEDAIVAGWDYFVQGIAYTGKNDAKGLFNSDDVVMATAITEFTKANIADATDEEILSFVNGIMETYLAQSNMNVAVLPDRLLVPTWFAKELTSRHSALYTATLREFICEHNLGKDESEGKLKLVIEGRPALNDLNRIVAYRKNKKFVRLDMPYPMQHYITLPNMERMSYTSLFVGQVSEIQLPYNQSAEELGIVTYWDITE